MPTLMDNQLLTLFNRIWIHPLLDWLMLALSSVGLALLPLTALRLKQRPRNAVLIGMAATAVLTAIFYYLALRPRPDEVRLLAPQPPFPSFPSGHSALAFSWATTMALIVRRRRVTLLFLGVASAIGYSRLYLGHHYPTDVVAGALLGSSTGAAAYGLLAAEARAWPDRLRWLLWPQIGVALLVTLMAYLQYAPLWLLRWPGADKVLHFLLFGAIAFWLNLWWKGRTLPGGPVPLAIIVPLGLAGGEEILQGFSAVRTADLTDLTADFAGLFLCWWLSHQLLKRSRTGAFTGDALVTDAHPGPAREPNAGAESR
jgi:membrane-associated phospholipid phosphatase